MRQKKLSDVVSISCPAWYQSSLSRYDCKVVLEVYLGNTVLFYQIQNGTWKSSVKLRAPYPNLRITLLSTRNCGKSYRFRKFNKIHRVCTDFITVLSWIKWTFLKFKSRTMNRWTDITAVDHFHAVCFWSLFEVTWAYHLPECQKLFLFKRNHSLFLGSKNYSSR